MSIITEIHAHSAIRAHLEELHGLGLTWDRILIVMESMLGFVCDKLEAEENFR